MKIIWNQVTRISQIVALVLFVGVFGLGFYLGVLYDKEEVKGAETINAQFGSTSQAQAQKSFVFTCAGGKSITAQFPKNAVNLKLSDGRSMTLIQTISGSGARYANKDESFVFWNKGNTAFIQENSKDTFTDCVTTN